MRYSLISLGLLACLVGCSTGPSIEGTWTSTGSKEMPKGTKFVTTFSKPDGMLMVMDMPQEIPGQKPINLHADIKGTYKLAGEIIDIKVEDVKMTGTGFPDNLKSMLEGQLKSMGDQVKSKLNENGKQKIKWEGNDKFVMSGSSGESTTFVRQK